VRDRSREGCISRSMAWGGCIWEIVMEGEGMKGVENIGRKCSDRNGHFTDPSGF
jgi:hypothetical protein